MAKVNPQDLLIWLVSFLACLLWSLEYGILLAVGVSACLTLYVGTVTSLMSVSVDINIIRSQL